MQDFRFPRITTRAHIYLLCHAVCPLTRAGVALRVGLGLAGLQPRLESALELVVPSTSWERAQEGLFLGSIGFSHYAGGVFTGSPLMLAAAMLCATLPPATRGLAAATMFAAFDLVSALLIRGICVRAIAVESRDWEARLEEWMDEDAKPRGRYHESPSAEKKSVSGASGVAGGGTCAVDWVALNLPDIVIAAYLLNPVLAAQCAALSGDVLGRVLPLAALAAAGAKRPGMTAAALAASACLWRFYAAALLVPAALVLARSSASEAGGLKPSPTVEECSPCCSDGDGAREDDHVVRASFLTAATVIPRATEASESGDGEGQGHEARRRSRHRSLGANSGNDPSSGADERNRRGSHVMGVEDWYDPRYFNFDTASFLRLCGAFLAWLAVVLGGCWLGTSGSWAFLSAAAREQLLCDNLTPNPGLYWYFFAEVFPRFRGFFRVLFLSQPYVYVLPATLRLGMFPEALAVLMFAIFGIFHVYPSLADPFLAGCLFLCYPRTSARMRLVIPVFMVALVPSFLLPIMRHLWLQAGTGNANFYYFQTIVLNLLWSVFVLQFAAALGKRRKALATAFVKRRKGATAAAAPAGKDVGGGVEEVGVSDITARQQDAND